MAKYDPIREILVRTGKDRVRMRFHEIATLVGGLPKSAYEYSAWWANEVGGNHVQAHAWMGAGCRVESFDLRGQWVTFTR